MVHDFSPILFSIYGNIAVRWYGLSYVLGFIAAYWMIRRLAKIQNQGMTENLVSDFITYGAIGVLAGGRLGYCAFYSPDLFLKFKADFPFWGVLAVNEGGMASHGGIIGLAVACVLFSIKHGINRWYLFDLVGLVGPIGIFFGRIANFINGELLGRASAPDFPLGVKFPSEIDAWVNSPDKLRSLTPVVEAIPQLSVSQWLSAVDAVQSGAGLAAARNVIYDGITQIQLAIQSGNLEAKTRIADLLTTRHPSQLYAALGEGLLLFVVLFLLWRVPRKPGFIGACFAIGYAAVRIVTEMFRLPDAHLGFQWLGLTRGQWLSVLMLVIAIIVAFFLSRREGLKVPGWGKGKTVKLHRRNEAAR